MNARFTSAAQADVAAALRWYRRNQPGLDSRFLLSLDRAVEAIDKHPELGSRVEGDIHRYLLRGFPHAVFYVPRNHEAIVIACLHGARDPERWRGRGAA